MHRFTLRPAGPPAPDDGMSTVEYAVGTLAAASFGALLYKVVNGEAVLRQLTKLITEALQ